MRAIFRHLWLVLLIFACPITAANSRTAADPPTAVVNALQSEDLVAAKLALDRAIDPSVNSASAHKEVQRLIGAARSFAGSRASEGAKIDAIRKVLYESGPWNDNRPFTYDQADPLGENIQNKLLSVYLKTRLGNCVTMPTLFMIVGRGIGLNLTLTTAPLHVLVRYTGPGDRPFNIEATSGGKFARDEWYRQNWSISDRAIESGLYLRTHTGGETVALMATTVLDYLIDTGRNEEAVAVADAILAANPKDGYTMVKKGSAIGAMVKAEFAEKYPIPALIPPPLRRRYAELAAANEKAFADAAALGWEAPSIEAN